jgi:hypothetical protein
MSEPITEEWLREVGFRSSQLERQPHKHWTLNLGWATDGGRFSTSEDVAIEISPACWYNRNSERVQAADGNPWHCWLKGEGRGFIHIRHLRDLPDLIAMLEALSGQPWDAANVCYGQLRTPEAAAAIRREDAARNARLGPRPIPSEEGDG